MAKKYTFTIEGEDTSQLDNSMEAMKQLLSGQWSVQLDKEEA